MRIVLYNPRAVFFTMPLALVAIGSALDRMRAEVRIVDGRIERDPVARVLRETDGALCLGVSVLTGRPIRDALAVTRAVKAARPDLPVIWGGWHPSLFPTECLEEPSIDAVVIGQGEETFREIVSRLAWDNGLDGCAGAAFRRGREIVVNPPRVLADVNTLPPLDYGLIDVERYFALKGRRQIDYISSQGCRFRCTFCADPQVYGRGWTGLAPSRVAGEIDALHRRYGIDEVAFQDETFFTNPARVEALSDELIARGLHIAWTATMRADQACRMSEAQFARAIASGLRRVMIGVESGSPQMLAWLKKDATVEQVLAAAERCARYGLEAIFNFIVGFPDEPVECRAETLALVKRIRAMHPRFETPIFYYRPYPGSDMAEFARARGYEFPKGLDAWADFDYVGGRSPWLSDAERRRIERFKFYARHAWDAGRWRWPLRAVSRWRCTRDFYAFPVEKHVVELVRPPAPVS
jgi:radical SAM superfamily enzyme YgiQ (UPF0313 family)